MKTVEAGSGERRAGKALARRRKCLGELVVAPSCCGRMAAIKVKAERLYGNVVDFLAGEPMKPKRIRIQRGNPALHGNVVQPGEYEFLWWADEEEDP